MTPPPRTAGRTDGFTLLETLAVVAITAFLIASVATMFIAIMNNTERAVNGTREARIAASVLDRVARDIEGAFLIVRDEEDDPLSHPWLFKAEARLGQEGADRVLFTTLSHTGRSALSERASAGGLATYAYWLEGDEEIGYDLVRHVRPSLAEDQRFPLDAEEGAVVVAEGLAGFALRFMGEAGDWSDSWDSSTLVDSSQLPRVVEISLQMPPLDPDEAAFREQFGDEVPPREFLRRVVLYQRPLTPEVALGIGSIAGLGDGDTDLFEEADENCPTMSFQACFNAQTVDVRAAIDADPDRKAALQRLFDECVPNFVQNIPTSGFNVSICM